MTCYCSQARNALDCAFREKTYSLKAKIHLRTNEVRIAIFAWIFACYWNGVNSNNDFLMKGMYAKCHI